MFAAVTGDAARVPRFASLTDAGSHHLGRRRDPDLDLNVSRALHYEIPHSTLTVLLNAHHNMMLDDPTASHAAG